MINDASNMVTVVRYRSNMVNEQTEVFFSYHAAEHRVNNLIDEWDDIENWEINQSDNYAQAINVEIGAEITLHMVELNTNGS